MMTDGALQNILYNYNEINVSGTLKYKLWDMA